MRPGSTLTHNIGYLSVPKLPIITFFHNLGIYGIIGPKKEAAKAVPVIPAVVPKDSDGDGIMDDNDKCPSVPGVAKYDGCPAPDSDKDGINDEEDRCPTVPGVARYQGCPIPDTDKDGINDEEDKCPNQAGVHATRVVLFLIRTATVSTMKKINVRLKKDCRKILDVPNWRIISLMHVKCSLFQAVLS